MEIVGDLRGYLVSLVCVCGGVLFRGSVGDQLATAENDFDLIFTYPKRHSGNIQIKQAFVFWRH